MKKTFFGIVLILAVITFGIYSSGGLKNIFKGEMPVLVEGEASQAQPQTENHLPQPIDGDYILMLVNKDNPISILFAPNLTEVLSVEMDVNAAPNLLELYEDAKSEGVELLVVSGYREKELQEYIFERSVNDYLLGGFNEGDALDATTRYIAYPGQSEHQTGLAVDIVSPSYPTLDAGFANTVAGRWLAENCAEYGFIIRYPEGKSEITGIYYEPWHLRYVGKEAAAEIALKGITLEEYIGE